MKNLKITKLLISLFLGSMISTQSHSTQIERYVSWDDLKNGKALIEYKSDYDDEVKYFEAEINHSRTGNQRIYFTDHSSLGSSTCSYESTIPKNSTIIFNGQAVKMLQWCKKYNDTGNFYLSMTPETDRGHSYVVNLFKIAISPIEIQFNNEKTYFPVIGFTKAWNSAGGNAI